MARGRIILLNGASSAGKTTLAHAIQDMAPEPMQLVALDQFRDGMAGRFRGMNSKAGEPGSRGLNVVPRDGLTGLEFGDVGRLTLKAMRRAIAAVADAGIDVVVDDLLLEGAFLDDYLDALAGYDVLFVGVRCDLATLNRRETARPGRFPGTAAAHFEQVHAGCIYDIEMDTAAATPRECAAAVYARWGEPPTAFDRLRATRRKEATSVQEPLNAARLLAGVYGHELDSPPTYPAGVALSGRLRLAALDGDIRATASAIADLTTPLANRDIALPAAAPCLAAACFADELHDATGDGKYQTLLLDAADRFEADPDIRVEDFFFAGTLLGRAFRLSGDSGYGEQLREVLLHTETRQPNGLYWHCGQSPWLWGRGNAFAALGFAEALSYVDDDDLLAAHLAHLRALAKHQDEAGLWRQVVDDSATRPEHSATTMIGCAIARGVRRGWLPAVPWRAAAERAWEGAAARIGQRGEIDGVCVGTGPLDSRDAYVRRPFSHGIDARGGAFSLWFAVELLRMQGGA